MKTLVVYLFLICAFAEIIHGVMLRKECPVQEIHRSCTFHEETTCWESAEMNERTKTSPRRLVHCRAGCFCKRGLVRAYPHGPCIPAVQCRNNKLLAVMQKLPKNFSGL